MKLLKNKIKSNKFRKYRNNRVWILNLQIYNCKFKNSVILLYKHKCNTKENSNIKQRF